jgi:cytochrome bd ubiquinol oxidase subunit II
MLASLWFALVAAMLAAYVVLDGFDLGAGAIHLRVARSEAERRQVLAAIGPVWDGNEVWLIAAAGTIYFAFPTLYAASFSGFYLPLMIVLWLLILRGIAIELRNHLDSPAWQPLWDVVFCASSLLLAIVFGTALGNVVRGVPLDAGGFFFEPLWTDLRPGAASGILDWYTLLAGLTALAALTQHGAAWLALKTTGAVRGRALRLARPAWWTTVALTTVLSLVTFSIQPHIPERLRAQPWGLVFPLLGVCALAGMRRFARRGADLAVFLSSCAFLAGMIASVAFGLYPYVLPASTDAARGLTVGNAAAAAYGLRIGLVWWIPGMVLAIGYVVFVYRHFAGRVAEDDPGYAPGGAL